MTISAFANMSGTLYAVAIVLIIGVIALWLLGPKNARSRIWLLITAFLAGPIIAMCFLLLDMFVVSRAYYITLEDYVQSSASVLVIGLIAGAVGAVVLWIGEQIRFKRPADANNLNGSNADQSESESGKVRRRWTSWLRLPPFAINFSISLLVCITFLGWITIDSNYRITMFVVRYSVGLEQFDPDPAVVAYGLWDMMWDGVCSWDSLGPRLCLFAFLSGTAAVSSSVMLFQFFRGVTIRRMLLNMLIVAAWLSLWVQYDKLNAWAVLRRARLALPRFEIAADSLLRNWPTRHGSRPELSDFYAYPDEHPNLLVLHGRDWYSIREDFGHLLERSDGGAIRFDLSGATDCRIEFHTDGSKPTSYSTRLSGTQMTLREAIQLKDQWYLVRYGG